MGAALAALTQPNSLLDGAQAGPPTQATAWHQIYHAKTVDTEGAWQAVLNRSDATPYQKSLARQGLVYLYLKRTQSFDSYENAIAHLEQLASSAQRSFRVFGIAGLVVAYTGLNEDDEAFKAYQRLTAEDRTLLKEQAPRMAELYEAAIDALLDRAS
jgi:hypothetical protein